ncbi:MAG: CHAT domain-containing protein [Cytophagales bacterium]|nr:CHAT domain-containing protein [Cytophagales bacterium]
MKKNVWFAAFFFGNLIAVSAFSNLPMDSFGCKCPQKSFEQLYLLFVQENYNALRSALAETDTSEWCAVHKGYYWLFQEQTLRITRKNSKQARLQCIGRLDRIFENAATEERQYLFGIHQFLLYRKHIWDNKKAEAIIALEAAGRYFLMHGFPYLYARCQRIVIRDLLMRKEYGLAEQRLLGLKQYLDENSSKEKANWDSAYGYLYNYLSYLYQTLGDIEKVEHFTKESLNRALSNNTDTLLILRNIENLSISAYYKGDYAKAIDLLKSSFPYSKSKLKGQKIIAQYYLAQMDYARAIHAVETVMPQEHLLSDKDRNVLYATLIRACFFLDKNEVLMDSLLLFSKKRLAGNDDFESVITHANLLLQMKRPRQAMRLLSEKLEGKQLSKRNRGFYYRILANSYWLSNNYKKTLEYAQKSIALLYPPEQFDQDGNLLLGQIQYVHKNTLKLQLLKAKSMAAVAKTASDWEKTLVQYRLALDLVDKIKVSLSRSESRQAFAFEAAIEVEGMIAACVELERLTGDQKYWAVYHEAIERTRAIVLLAEMQEEETHERLTIPQKLDSQLQETKLLRNFYRKQLLQSRLVKDSLKIPAQERYVRKFQLRYDSLSEQLAEHYPGYYQMHRQTQYSTLKYVQDSLLQPRDIMLEYLEGDGRMHLLAVTKDSVAAFEIPMDEALKEAAKQVGRYLHCIDSFYYEGRTEAYLKNAHLLFRAFVEPALRFMPKADRIIAMPDGVLRDIPFEALLKEKADTRSSVADWKLIVRDHAVLYAHSATLWNYHERQPSPRKKLLAIAPGYRTDWLDHYTSPISLKYSVEEVEALTKVIYGNWFTGADARKSAFTKQVDKYGILHMAMHASADFDNPELSYLIFSGEPFQKKERFMFGTEIQSMNLSHLQLVVLNACQSASGRQAKGDIPASLSRAFLRSGVKSLVSNIWNVRDKAAKELSLFFYRHLTKGMSKSEALRLAKIDMMTQASNEAYRYPPFWSSTVLTGSDAPLDYRKNWGQRAAAYLFPVLVLLLLGAVWLLWRAVYRKKRMSVLESISDQVQELPDTDFEKG